MRSKLLTANKGEDNAGANKDGENESVHMVPRWGPSLDGGTSVVVVQEGEGTELGDQSVLGGHEKRGPGDGGSDDTGGITPVTDRATVLGPFETPVDGTEEGKYLAREKAGLDHGSNLLTPEMQQIHTTAPYPICRGSMTFIMSSAVSPER